MHHFSIRNTLRDAAGLVSSHSIVLLTYGLIGVVVPYLLLGSEPIFAMRPAIAAAADPHTYRLGGSINGPLYLLGIISIIVAGARMAALIAIQSDAREGVLGEMMTGIVGGTLHFAAYIVVVGVMTAALILTMPMIGSGSLSLWAAALSSALAFLGGIWLRSRLLLAAPFMARAGTINPVPAMARSFRATRPVAGRAFLLILLVEGLLSIALPLMLLGHVVTIVARPAGTLLEWGFTLGWALVFMVWFLILVLIPLAVSRALYVNDISDTFA